jgi:galactokinase
MEDSNSPRPDARRRAVEALRDRFGAEALLVGSGQGRVNLIGDHTDYNGGHVLPLALTLTCVAAAGLAAGGQSRLYAADLSEEVAFAADTDLRGLLGTGGFGRGSWASYALGVLQGFRERGIKVPPLDVAVASDVPLGAGLSSSAALEVAIAGVAEAAAGVRLEPMEKARLCRRAEHEFAGVPCGIMDQMASVLGSPDYAVLIDCRGEAVKARVPLPARERAGLLIIDSGVRHTLADGEYARRRGACSSAAQKLGVEFLCDLSINDGLNGPGAAALSEEERRCARHAISENRRTLAAAGALASGDLGGFGRLMNESHDSLRDEYRVSCAEVDAIVDAARGQPGVLGARITGGGFGGCAVVLAQAHAAAAVVSGIQERFSKEFDRKAARYSL